MKQQLLSVKDFCSAYGLGRTRTYELIGSGAVEAVKDGAKTLITAESAERWAQSLPSFRSVKALKQASPATRPEAKQ